MNHFKPDSLANSRDVFRDHAGHTLEDIRQRVLSEPVSTNRRDTLSALNSITELFGLHLGSVPANARAVRDIIGEKMPSN